MRMETPAAHGPTARGLSRPPLHHRPRGATRSLKQREREAPNIDWERSLQHFAVVVSDDLNELHTRFMDENVVTFAAWKRLWRDARLSAAFHVEFWESTPTNIHKTILQQTLDGLVGCIQEHNGGFDTAADVAALIGRVFALYCAYSVQLGAPKHKIDVDPQAWAVLLTINCVVCGVGASLFPTAAREVRAMFHRLAVKENAFLRCLKGFGSNGRVENRVERVQAAEEAGTRPDLSLVAHTATEEDIPVKQDKVEQIKSLGDRYQELMNRARSTGSTGSGAGARLGGRRGKPAAVSASMLSGSMAPATENGGQELVRALASYMEYKSNEEARRNDRVARAIVARENEEKVMLEQANTERDDSSDIVDLSDRGSVISPPSSPMAKPATSNQYGLIRRRSGGDSEDFLAELESELHADVSTDHVGQPLSLAFFTRHRDKEWIPESSAASEISEADNDALADLERELAQSVDTVSTRARREGVPAIVPDHRTTGQHLLTVLRKDHEVETTTAKAPRKPTTRNLDKLPSAISEVSGVDVDPLADLERELEQSIGVRSFRPRKGEVPEMASPPVRGKRDSNSSVSRNVPHAKPTTTRAPQTTTRRRNQQSSAVSEISEADSDALADLERELEQSVGGISSGAKSAPKKTSLPTGRKRGRPPATGIVSRKSPRTAGSPPKPSRTCTVENNQPTAKHARSESMASHLSFADSWAASSAVDSDGLAAIQAELDTMPTLPGPTKVVLERTCRDIDTEQHCLEPRNGAVQLSAAEHKAKQPAGQSEVDHKSPNQHVQAIQHCTRSRTRALSAVSDSSELVAQLQAELDCTPSPKATTRTKASDKASAAVVKTRLRRSSRLSSVASEADSNALEELEDELNATSATLGAGMSRSSTVPTKVTAPPQRAVGSKRPAQRMARGNARKVRSEVAGSVANTVRQPPDAQMSCKTTSKQQSSKPGIASQEPSRISSVSSDTESDGMTELVAELDTTEAIQTSTTTQHKGNFPTNARPQARHKLPKAVASWSSPAHSTAPPRTAAPSATGLRRSARLSSLASDTESDGLEDLMAELDNPV